MNKMFAKKGMYTGHKKSRQGIVLIPEGKSDHVAHTWRKIGKGERKKIRVVTVLDLIKCLKHIDKY